MRSGRNGSAMHRGQALAAGLAALAAAAVLAAGASSTRGPGYDSVYPPEMSGVTFSHAKHAGHPATCLTCHPGATKSRYASERLLPRHEECAPCHPGAQAALKDARLRAGKTCLPCHEKTRDGDRPLPGEHPRPNIHFNHEKHANAGMDCKDCHRFGAGEPSAERGLPDMQLCFRCHDGTKASSACRQCHLTTADGRIVTAVGEHPLKPPSWLLNMEHGPDWVKRHFRSAAQDSVQCGACHQDRYCLDCHAGRVRVRDVHPGDWIHLHSVAGRFDNPRCRGCHNREGFCQECHRRTGFASDSPAGTLNPPPRPFHPEGWSQGAHSRDARRNIGACVSCHSEGSCTRCHARVKPHPSDWRSRCRSLALRNPTSCRRCHDRDRVNDCR